MFTSTGQGQIYIRSGAKFGTDNQSGGNSRDTSALMLYTESGSIRFNSERNVWSRASGANVVEGATGVILTAGTSNASGGVINIGNTTSTVNGGADFDTKYVYIGGKDTTVYLFGYPIRVLRNGDLTLDGYTP